MNQIKTNIPIGLRMRKQQIKKITINEKPIAEQRNSKKKPLNHNKQKKIEPKATNKPVDAFNELAEASKEETLGAAAPEPAEVEADGLDEP